MLEGPLSEGCTAHSIWMEVNPKRKMSKNFINYFKVKTLAEV